MESVSSDILFLFANHLEATDFLALIQCSRRMKTLVDTERFWQFFVMKRFGSVAKDDVTMIRVTWKDVYRIFWLALRISKAKVLNDSEGNKWPVLVRFKDRCMLIPGDHRQIIPRRGDIMLGHWPFNSKGGNEPRVVVQREHQVVVKSKFYGTKTIAKGVQIVKLETRYGTSFAIPLEFCYPEFPARYFFHISEMIINIKMNDEMIDEMVSTGHLTLEGEKPIKVPSYEYPLALIPDVSIFTWCPLLGCFDEA